MRSRNFTRDEAIKKHRIMWNWIAQTCIQEQRIAINYDSEVADHFGWYEIQGITALCNYDVDNGDCDKCPLIWPGDSCIYLENDSQNKLKFSGLIHLYQSAKDYVEAARIAYQIADLPERRTHGQQVQH